MSDQGGPRDYHSRLRYQLAMARWLQRIKFELFVTLSFRQNVGLDRARASLRHWFACLDSHYLGKNWRRRSTDQRTAAVACPENIISNLHYHCLLKLPERSKSDVLAEQEWVLKRAWVRAAPGGTCHVQLIRDRGAARYATKQVIRPNYWQYFVLASEFHSAEADALQGQIADNLRVLGASDE